MRTRLMAVVAVLGMLLAACGGTSPEAAGPGEGIQVHGDWTIDIYNEDGSLDERVEFSNALASSGAEVLAGLLDGSHVTDRWQIHLTGSENVCARADGTRYLCVLDDRTDLADTDSAFYNLVLERGASGAGELTMTGSLQASHDGDISNVESRVQICLALTSEGNCPSVGSQIVTFTETDISPAFIQAGQIAQVEVVISFTSG